MKEPVRRDVGRLYPDAAVPGHFKITGRIQIPCCRHIDLGMASHSSQSGIADPWVGGLAVFSQFHIASGVYGDGGIGSGTAEPGPGHGQPVFGGHIAPGTKCHLGTGFGSLRIPDGQIVSGNGDGIQTGVSGGIIPDASHPEFINGDIPGLGIADVHRTGTGHAEGLDMQVPGHIPGSQVHRAAAGCIDTLAAGNGKILPVQFHRSPGTLSPRLHRIDGHSRKVLCSRVSCMEDATCVKSAGKGDVFPQDGGISPVSAAVVLNGHLSGGIRSHGHLVLVPPLEILHRDGVSFRGISAPFVHIIVSSACRRIRRQGHISRQTQAYEQSQRGPFLTIFSFLPHTVITCYFHCHIPFYVSLFSKEQLCRMINFYVSSLNTLIPMVIVMASAAGNRSILRNNPSLTRRCHPSPNTALHTLLPFILSLYGRLAFRISK